MPQSFEMTLDQAVELVSLRAKLGVAAGMSKQADFDLSSITSGAQNFLGGAIRNAAMPDFSKMSPTLRNTLIGAGGGLGLGLIGTMMSRKKKKQYIRNALLAALLGGGLAGGGTMAANYFGDLNKQFAEDSKPTPPVPVGEQIKQTVSDNSQNIMGGIAGATLGHGIDKKLANKRLVSQMRGMNQKQLDALSADQKAVREIKNFQNTANTVEGQQGAKRRHLMQTIKHHLGDKVNTGSRFHTPHPGPAPQVGQVKTPVFGQPSASAPPASGVGPSQRATISPNTATQVQNAHKPTTRMGKMTAPIKNNIGKIGLGIGGAVLPSVMGSRQQELPEDIGN